ncbi:MAG: TatD family hydrolase [Anaerolineae bacterium]|nr:TatD family hydrolase [Anaerolineae bacterium]MCX8068107.1 TatD family hydrolase [Anaerolineae bacterium]MDW7991717.1 TatD family hydrolase [Anaerolineae bacterium]
MNLVDSHAHLDFPPYDGDREEVVARAREAGVCLILNVGADLESSRASVELAQRYDFIYAAVGIHPHDAQTLTPDALEELRALARRPKVVAIGEIGLDYYRDLSPRPNQREAFEQQLALAEELGLPVVLHCRDAMEDLLAILRGWKGEGVLHSYSGGPGRLEEALALGLSIGISGPVTFANAHRLREVAARVPLDRLLTETDCPYLTPEPHRGKRNEPAYVRYVVESIAQARSVPAETVAHAALENALRLFGIPNPLPPTTTTPRSS